MHIGTEATPQLPFSRNMNSVSRRESRNSLIGFLGRHKSPKARKAPPELFIVAEDSAVDDGKLQPLSPRREPINRRRGSPVQLILSPESTQSQLSVSTNQSKSMKSPRSPRTLTAWDPPPLFQAYPQSIKHSSLRTASTESNLIQKAHKVVTSSGSDGRTNTPPEEQSPGSPGADEAEKSRRHKRRRSGSLGQPELAGKTYVLVTSGYLLQYSNDGTFDRLPEKMLRLGKDSAVFVSDAIPGQPFVLQVSKYSSHNGKCGEDKSFFAKFKIRSGDSRRSADNFLMIFDDPEAMQSWMLTIRREIESLGGQIRPVSPSKPLPSPVVLEHKLSERYLVTRGVNRNSWTQAPSDRLQVPSFASSDQSISEDRSARPRSAQTDQNRLSWAPTEAPSLSTTATTADLEDSRDFHRSPPASNRGNRYSVYSSPPNSPLRQSYDFSLPDLAPFDYPEPPHKLAAGRPSAMAWKYEGGESGREEDGGAAKSSSKSSRSPSPAPNFSVPTFSHRFGPNPQSPEKARPRPPKLQVGLAIPPTSGVYGGQPQERPTSTISNLPSPSAIIAPPKADSLRYSHEILLTVPPPYDVDQSPLSREDEVQPDNEKSSMPAIDAIPSEAIPLNGIDLVPSPEARPKRMASLGYGQGILPASLPPVRKARQHNDRSELTPGEYDDNKPDAGVRSVSSPASMQRALVLTGKHSTLPRRTPPRLPLTPRKSMPNMTTLGPPAPPPDCPLPALPSIFSASQDQKVRLRSRQSLHLPRSPYIPPPSDPVGCRPRPKLRRKTVGVDDERGSYGALG